MYSLGFVVQSAFNDLNLVHGFHRNYLELGPIRPMVEGHMEEHKLVGVMVLVNPCHPLHF